MARLIGEFSAPARIELVTREMSDAEIWRLHERGDCYVSLCRSEGWGLPAFDAASLATPVVITGYGGQLEYLDDDNADLVRYDLVAVDDPAGEHSYTPDQTWAEPHIGHAAELLRQVRAAPAPARVRAQAAQRLIRDRYAPEQVGQILRAAIAPLAAGGARRGWRAKIRRPAFRRAG